MKNCYVQKLRSIEAEIIKENELKEKMKKEFDVQSDSEMPRIYKKYITEQQVIIDPPIYKAYNKSQRFILSRSVNFLDKQENKGIIGSVFGMFGRKPDAKPTFEKPMDEITPEEISKLEIIERGWNIEELYKVIQEVIEHKSRDPNEIAKIIYTLKLAFCENHIALSNAIKVAIVFLYKFRMYTNYQD